MARRYRFRLDSVLRVRRIQEELARKELVEAVRDQTTAQEKLVRRSEHYAGLPPAASDLAADDFLSHRSRSIAAAAAVAAARANWQMSMAVTDARRVAWAEAETKVKSLERLDERHREEHRQEELRFEQREVDDLVARPRRQDDDR